MTEMIQVKAVAGRKLPVEGKAGAHVGYKKGSMCGTVSVRSTSYIRRAIRRGDLAIAKSESKGKTGSAKAEKGS